MNNRSTGRFLMLYCKAL